LEETLVTAFLEYLCETLIGPPALRRGDGHSEWDCPVCGKHRKFSTYPHNPSYRDRAGCFVCGWRGDEHDRLRLVVPGEDYPRRSARLERLRIESEAEQAAAAKARTADPRPVSSLRGMSGGENRPAPRQDQRAIGVAFADLTDDQTKLLHAALALAKQVCPADPEGLLWYTRDFFRWIDDTNARHMAECTDARCDWSCCRRARGGAEQAIRRHGDRLRARAAQARQERAERLRHNGKNGEAGGAL
jgi:hypothetical protein